MKPFVFFVLLLTISYSAYANEPDFSIEESGLEAVPAAVEKAIRAKSSYDIGSCTLVGKQIQLSDSETSPADYAVTIKNNCNGAASAGPLWVIRDDQGKYKEMLNQTTYSLFIEKETSHGLHNLRTTRSTAEGSETELWSFGDKKYEKTESLVFTAKDTKTCREHEDLCPFVLDRNGDN